jgi:hypothetical protein
MNSSPFFLGYKLFLMVLVIVLITFEVTAQEDTEKWKMQISLGVNNPIDDNSIFETKSMNFPAVNLGVQHMFSRELGAKLDFGFYRSKNDDGSPDFKLNYSRINAQLVYDISNRLLFIPDNWALIAHVGPGLSFSKPLNNYSENKYTFLNALGGLEIHYRLSEALSIYSDIGYVLSLSGDDKYNTLIDGFSFNDNLMYVTFGVSVSLSGCQHCD